MTKRKPTYTHEQLVELMERQRAEQGLPPRITDPAALKAIARLVQAARTQPK